MKKYTSFLLFIFVTITSFCQVTGHISDESLGIAFDIPADWFGQELEDVFLMSSLQEGGLMAMMFHPAQNVAQLQTEMKQGLSDASIYLMPVGQLQSNGTDRVEGQYSGMLEGQKVKGKAVALINPHGQGVVVLSLIEEHLYGSRTDDLVNEVANSIQFSQAARAAAYSSGDPDINAGTVRQDLANHKLTYMDSYSSNTPGGGGYEIRKEINLCPNGNFTAYDSSYMSTGSNPNFDPHSSNGTFRGTYEFVDYQGGVYLQLMLSDGHQENLEISYEGTKVFLDGGRYYRGDVECN